MSNAPMADEKARAIKELQDMLPDGSTVYTILRHVSASGATRRISCVVIENGRLLNIDFLVARNHRLQAGPQ